MAPVVRSVEEPTPRTLAEVEEEIGRLRAAVVRTRERKIVLIAVGHPLRISRDRYARIAALDDAARSGAPPSDVPE